jgi:GntR family transcriptional regulator/MocR family aminotransferase
MNTNHNFAVQRISKEYTFLQSSKGAKKYIILYTAIKGCILKRELPDAWLLPPTRILSSAMKLSRTTILKAYELLLLEKLIISKIGSGNRVHFKDVEKTMNITKERVPQNANYPEISQKGQAYLKNLDLLNRLPTNDVAFRPGLPPLDVFPVHQWKKLLNTYWMHVKSSGLAYSQSAGLNELKNGISNYLQVSRNLKCRAEQIVIVSGSLQSLYLIANTLLNKGDAVVLENPVFPNVHSVFKSSEAQLIPANLDNEGIDLSKLVVPVNSIPKLIHVTPSNHYPTGVRMTLSRRQELLEWASKNKALIIENDYEHEIANATNPIPTIYTLDRESRTIYVGTFNRLLHPSIRLGYMIVPSYLSEAVEALQEHSHRFVSPSIQMVMNQFIERSYLYKHLERSIVVARERYDLFISEFNLHCKTMYIQPASFSSFHVVAHFKDYVTEAHEREVIKKLNNRNITAFSLSKCYITGEAQLGLILGYAAVRTAVMKYKIKIMSEVI